ncbi:hypothetical protein QKA_2775 [Clostridioides difficile DA00165]|nr:hypothetical protein QKA_2775 [Clostridioides difficile DA00165]
MKNLTRNWKEGLVVVLRRLLMQVRDNLKAGCHKHEDEKYF